MALEKHFGIRPWELAGYSPAEIEVRIDHINDMQRRG